LDIQGTVLNVAGRSTKTGKTVYDISFSDGVVYSTFDNALATQAQGLQGQPVVINGEVRQNGQYTNHNLIAIRAAAGGLVAGPGASPSLPLGASIIPIAPATQGRGRDPEVEARIVRQSSMATAFNFVGHVLSGSGEYDNAKETALALAKELFGHAFHGGGADKGQTPQQPSEVAAQVNTVLGTEAVTQGAPEATKDW